MTEPVATIPVPDRTSAVVVRIEGTPISWKRARRGKGGASYTDPKVKGWQRVIATTIDAHLRSLGHFQRPVYGPDEAVALEVVAAFPRPQTATRPLPLGGYADVDNLAKAPMDALQESARRAAAGILYADDSQVAHLTAAKCYVDGDGFLEVTVMDCHPTDTERDPEETVVVEGIPAE